MSGRPESTGSWLAALLAAELDRLRAAVDAGLCDEPDGIHQVRVSCRRVRSHVRVFAKPAGAGWADDVSERLRDVADACGPARDLEVVRDRVDSPPALTAVLTERAQGAAESARHALAGPATGVALDTLRRAAADARQLDPAAGLERLAGRTWRGLVTVGDALGPDSPDAAWHRVRVRAKRARYTSEATAAALGPSVEAQARFAKRVQTVLGEHQDAVVAIRLLTEAAAETPRVADAATERIGVEQAEIRRLRAAFLELWTTRP